MFEQIQYTSLEIYKCLHSASYSEASEKLAFRQSLIDELVVIANAPDVSQSTVKVIHEFISDTIANDKPECSNVKAQLERTVDNIIESKKKNKAISSYSSLMRQ